MTFKNGFIGGVGVGIIAWTVSARVVVLDGENGGLPSQVYWIAQVISLISIVILVVGVFRGKSVISTAFGGFISGFLLGFELPTIWAYLSHGQLPPP